MKEMMDELVRKDFLVCIRYNKDTDHIESLIRPNTLDWDLDREKCETLKEVLNFAIKRVDEYISEAFDKEE